MVDYTGGLQNISYTAIVISCEICQKKKKIFTFRWLNVRRKFLRFVNYFVNFPDNIDEKWFIYDYGYRLFSIFTRFSHSHFKRVHWIPSSLLDNEADGIGGISTESIILFSNKLQNMTSLYVISIRFIGIKRRRKGGSEGIEKPNISIGQYTLEK